MTVQEFESVGVKSHLSGKTRPLHTHMQSRSNIKILLAGTVHKKCHGNIIHKVFHKLAALKQEDKDIEVQRSLLEKE